MPNKTDILFRKKQYNILCAQCKKCTGCEKTGSITVISSSHVRHCKEFVPINPKLPKGTRLIAYNHKILFQLPENFVVETTTIQEIPHKGIRIN